MNNTHVMLRTILVAIDLEEGSTAALRYAQAVASKHGSELVIVHVIDPVGYAFTEGDPVLNTAGLEAQKELNKIEDDVRRRGISVRSVLQRGVICDSILDEVKTHRADLLVLGTSARTEVGRVALGSVTRRLLVKCPCPILTVTPKNAERTLNSAGGWRRILVAMDFSEPSLAALGCAHQLVRSQLFVLHACSSENTAKCPGYLEHLRLLAPMNESHTVPVEHFAVSGDISELIVEYARRLKVDLIVLGSPPQELSDEELHASTVLRTISGVDCPVLCVPSTTEAAAAAKPREVAMA